MRLTFDFAANLIITSGSFRFRPASKETKKLSLCVFSLVWFDDANAHKEYPLGALVTALFSQVPILLNLLDIAIKDRCHPREQSHATVAKDAMQEELSRLVLAIQLWPFQLADLGQSENIKIERKQPINIS